LLELLGALLLVADRAVLRGARAARAGTRRGAGDMSAREPLSVFVTTLDNAATLELCLASVDWADEILVLDSGSTDATAAIAARPFFARRDPRGARGRWPGRCAVDAVPALRRARHRDESREGQPLLERHGRGQARERRAVRAHADDPAAAVALLPELRAEAQVP